MARPSNSIPVSVAVMTKNEAANIRACLESVRDFAEIFVVDSGSEDDTADIARSLGATVCDFVWNGRYPKKKQWSLENLPWSHDLVFYLDADERMTPALVDEIRSLLVPQPRARGWFVALDYVWEGRALQRGDRMLKLSMFDRRVAQFVEIDDLAAQSVGEMEVHVHPSVDGPVGRLSGTVLHDDHDSLFDWFDRHNRYSDWEAVLRVRNALTSEHESTTKLRGFAKRNFRRLPARPLVWFLYAYLARGGWREGSEGFTFAVAKAFYQWQINMKTRELRRLGATPRPPKRQSWG